MRAGRQVRAEDAVKDAVAPGTLTPADAAQYSFSGEAGLLQRFLLRDVARRGDGLDAVDGGVREQVARQLALRLGAVALSPRLGEQRYPDLPAGRRRAASSLPPVDQAEQLLGPRH